jgi:ethanolamine utilization protein EutA
MISGGVADYVYSDNPPRTVEEVSRYGDFGPLLGWALREALLAEGLELLKPLETVRATVIGTGTQSVNLSGSTIHVHEQTLPLRNVLVSVPFAGWPGDMPETETQIAVTIKRAIESLSIEEDNHPIALALQGPATLSFPNIQALARGILDGMREYLNRAKPLIIILEKDCGKILGQSISALSAKPLELICIDQLSVNGSDYIDIGKPLMGGRVVPVIIKTLVFAIAKEGGHK